MLTIYFISGLLALLFFVIPPEQTAAQIMIFVLCQGFMVGVFYMIGTYTQDVFSTDIRGTTFNFLDCVSKVYLNQFKLSSCQILMQLLLKSIFISNSTSISDRDSFSPIHSWFRRRRQRGTSFRNIWNDDDILCTLSLFSTRNEGVASGSKLQRHGSLFTYANFNLRETLS